MPITTPDDRNKVRFLAYLVVFTLFLGYTLVPIFGTNLSRYPGDLGDPRFILYLLEHNYKYATGQDPSFWSAGFFYPHHNVVAYSECFIGSSMFYIPFRMAGLDRETAFQYWTIVGFALNFAAMAFVLDRLRFRWLSVVLGAAVFTFSPVQFTHLGHLQLLYRLPIPLAWYFLDRFLDEYRPRSLAWALLSISWQFYMSPYLGYFLCLFLLFYVLAVVMERNMSLRAHYLAGTQVRARLWHAGLLTVFGLSLYPLFSYYSAPAVYRNTAADVTDLLPRPLSYLIGSRGNLMENLLGSPFAILSKYPWEHALFVGLLPWAGLLAMMVLVVKIPNELGAQPRRMLIAFWGVFLLTLWVAGGSVYEVVLKVLPGLTGIRVMSRVVFVLLLPFGYLAAAALERLPMDGWGAATKRMAVPIAVAACIAFGWETGVGAVTTDKRYAQDRVIALEKTMPIRKHFAKVTDGGPILAALWVDDSPSGDNTQLDAMLAAQDLNMVTLNGYSRFLAPGFRHARECETLGGILLDYQRTLPSFSAQQVASRLVVAPQEINCGNLLAGKRSKSTGPLPADAYAALIAPKCVACPTAPGSTLSVAIAVTNLSERSWPQDGISLSTRFVRTSDGGALSGFDNRFPIGTDFSPHESKQYVIKVKAPAEEGDYRMDVDLVQELVAWFSNKGTKRGELAIRVRAAEAK